ncbi:phage tail tape measure protein [Aeromicrobium sp.]|uniref:phage tail tape measure protein n=1 Tax=Aeromicrobium sp. TaxID=1871063 RepID=UPI0030BD0B3D
MSVETRQVIVRLRAEMDQYKRQMRSAEAETERLRKQMDRSSLSVGKFLAAGVGIGAAWKIGDLIRDSAMLEAVYSKTMAQVAVATDAPAAGMERLDDLAMKLGADTVFSAKDASEAMLELAKGGLSTAQIEAGALRNSLTLAAAGGLELGDAAESVVNTMGAFGLSAEDTGAAVAALAGAANASTADVQDITQALAQAGTEADSVGLSVQETTAILAAFSNAGIQGSDAGTSLRTMLTRLVPQTSEAANEMGRLGLKFTNANGEFVSAEQIAGRLQQAYKGMSAEERSASLSTVFGADARRAANVLVNEGAEGVRGLVKETSDLKAAQKLADAGMSGTAGSLEQLNGAVETAKIQIGKGLAPTIQDLADRASGLAADGDFESWAADGGAAISDFLDEMAPLASTLAELAKEGFPALRTAAGLAVDVLEAAADVVTPLVEGFNSLPDAAQQALILAAGAKTLSNRLGPLPGLSDSAGSSLMLFGGNAKKGGDDAAKGARGFGALAGSLKGNALLIGATFGLAEAGHVFGNVQDLLKTTGDQSKDFTRTFSEGGRATQDTLAAIQKSLDGGSVGKYAGDLGINLDKLAESLASSGSEGEYVREVMSEIVNDQSSWTNWSKEAGSLVPFLETDGERAAQVRNALKDLNAEYDKAAAKARKQARAVDEAANGYNLLINGFGEYVQELQGLPTEAVTTILTPGAVESKDDVLALAEQYELTPNQVKTIMKALDLAKPVIRAVKKALQDVDGDSATVTLTTIQETIKRSYTDPGTGGNNPAVDRAFGGRRADGGEINGVGGPREDNILIAASVGEHMWTAAEVAAVGGQGAMYAMRAAVRAGNRPRFADGGGVSDAWDQSFRSAAATYGSPALSVAAAPSAAPSGPYVVSSELVGARVGVDKDGIFRFVDGRIESRIASHGNYQSGRNHQGGRPR